MKEKVESISKSKPDKDFREQIGKRIAQVRGNLTRKEFGGQLGCHWNTIGQYERGDRLPGPDIVNQICDLFQISHQWLLTALGFMKCEEGEFPFKNNKEACPHGKGIPLGKVLVELEKSTLVDVDVLLKIMGFLEKELPPAYSLTSDEIRNLSLIIFGMISERKIPHHEP